MPKVLIGNTDSSNEPERPKKTFISNIHGDDAYELAVENGFQGDMQEWLASLEGEVGFTPFFVVTDTHIQVGYQRGTEVIPPVNLVNLDDLRPEAGSARWDTILNKPDKFPPEDHKHPASDIEGLVGDISKAEAVEMDEEILRLAKEHADALTVDWDSLSGKPLSFIPAAHTHTISGVDGLDIALSNKTDVGHGHSASEISGLPDPGTSKTYVDEELAKKANISHTHQASDISGLPAAPDVTKAYVDSELTKKSNTTHTHDFGTLTNRPTSYPPSAHQHPASDITGLPEAPDVSKAYVDSEMDKKANASHQHTFDSITQKPTSYPPSTHTHPASDITGLPTASKPVDVQTFYATGTYSTATTHTWVKPAGAKIVQVLLISAGGGGGQGGSNVLGSTVGGGGGGGAGNEGNLTFPADMLSDTVTVQVPKGGRGGIGGTTNSWPLNTQPAKFGGNLVNSGSPGNPGSPLGNNSAGGGAWGAGVFIQSPNGGPGANDARYPGQGGGSSNLAVQSTGGGGGSGLSSNNDFSNAQGGIPGNSWAASNNPTVGVTGDGANGAHGLRFGASLHGTGGGGGTGGLTKQGGRGGDGATYGGGGGGGGAGRTYNGGGGDGGNGGDGLVVVTCFF